MPHPHLHFRQLDAVLEHIGVDPATAYDVGAARTAVDRGSSFIIVNLPSEAAAVAIASRAVLVRRVLELWGHGETVQDCVAAVKAAPRELTAPHFEAHVSWSFSVDPSRWAQGTGRMQGIALHSSNAHQKTS